jgi:hypothetical protein
LITADPGACTSRFVSVGAVDGVGVTVELAIATKEHRRRRRASIGAISSLALLEQLAAIGPDWVVANAADRALARRSPALVEMSERPGRDPLVRSLARAVVTPLRITVRADRWWQGFKTVSGYAGLAERVLTLRAFPPDRDLAVLECQWFGVGLEVVTPEKSISLVSSAPFEPVRFTPTAWQFGEQLYRQWLGATPDRTSARP